MSTLKLQIEADIKTAMKEKDAIARDILRVVKGEIERSEDASKKLDNGAIVKLLKKQIENITETKSDNGEIAILEKYIPSQMTTDEITAVVKERIIADSLTGPKDMGKVMQYFKANYDGTYDGKVLSEVVKSVLN